MERLVVDAHSGRILRRYPIRQAVRRQVPILDGLAPLTNLIDGLFGSGDDVAPLAPPPVEDFVDQPKPRTQTKRPKTEPTPVVQRAKAPAEGSATVVPAPVAPSAPTVAPAAAANSPTPKASTSKLNDVPVAPLE